MKGNVKSATITIRQQIIEMLKMRSFSAQELSKSLSIKQHEVEEHLQNVAKTASGQNMEFIIYPAVCTKCNFEFESRNKMTKPSRCPKCKYERIDSPVFEIKEKDHENGKIN